jgi:hypothetical protein
VRYMGVGGKGQMSVRLQSTLGVAHPTLINPTFPTQLPSPHPTPHTGPAFLFPSNSPHTSCAAVTCTLQSGGVLYDVYLTNGLYQPSLAVAPGAWTRMEVVNAVGDTYLELEVRTGVALGA